MVTYTVDLSRKEADLVSAIRALQFGTLSDLEIPDEKPVTSMILTRPLRDMIEKIREGWRSIDLIQIHQSEPSYMEVRTVVHGLSGTKRFKFQ